MTRNSVKRLSLTFCLQQRHRQIWPSLYIDTHCAFQRGYIFIRNYQLKVFMRDFRGTYTPFHAHLTQSLSVSRELRSKKSTFKALLGGGKYENYKNATLVPSCSKASCDIFATHFWLLIFFF